MTTIKLLTSPDQRSTGAMFTSALGEKVLVFAYPTSFNRVSCESMMAKVALATKELNAFIDTRMTTAPEANQ
jgi:hypothetical protein